jgi:hypothetical protein
MSHQDEVKGGVAIVLDQVLDERYESCLNIEKALSFLDASIPMLMYHPVLPQAAVALPAGPVRSPFQNATVIFTECISDRIGHAKGICKHFRRLDGPPKWTA